MDVRHGGLLLAFGLLAGCAGTRTSVSSSAHLPSGQPVIAVESHEKLVLPAEFVLLDPPVFPAEADRTPGMSILVCLSFTVDEGGEVVDIRPETFPAPDCVDAGASGSSPFLAAATAAVARWSFLAAAVCTFESAEAAKASDEDCGSATSVRAIPVRLAWTFRFAVDRDGRSTVPVRLAWTFRFAVDRDGRSTVSARR